MARRVPVMTRDQVAAEHTAAYDEITSIQGRRAGLSDALVDALREKKPLPAMPPEEAAVVHYGLELTATNKVRQATFQAARDQLGVQGLTEFTTSMGYFRLLALNANAFTIDLPEPRPEPRQGTSQVSRRSITAHSNCWGWTQPYSVRS